MSRLCFLFLLSCWWTLASCQNQDSLLYHAYNSNSKKELRLFFENWAAETPPLAPEASAKLTGVEKDVYSIFELFYTPRKVNEEAGYSWGDSANQKANYFVLQDQVTYYVLDTTASFFQADIDYDALVHLNMARRDKSDTVHHFRPRLQYRDAKPLFLTPYYSDTLSNFLLEHPYYKPSIWSRIKFNNFSELTAESYKRGAFLQPEIKLFWVAFNQYWRIYSFPYVTWIVFDKNYQHAVIDYWMNHESGYAYLKKVHGDWTLVKVKSGWGEPL